MKNSLVQLIKNPVIIIVVSDDELTTTTVRSRSTGSSTARTRRIGVVGLPIRTCHAHMQCVVRPYADGKITITYTWARACYMYAVLV